MSKPQLHISALNMLSRCGEQFRRRYKEGEIIPPGMAMIAGTGTHRSVALNLKMKMDTGALLPLEDAKAIARDKVNAEWEKGVRFDENEILEDPKKLRGQTVDQAIRLAGLHAEQRAPALSPTHVERPWAVELPDYPYDLVGQIDIQEADLTIRDTKTSKKSPNANLVHASDQLTAYALAVRVLDGVAPPRVAFDYLIDLKRAPVVKVFESTRTTEDFNVLLARVENAAKAIDAGIFVPARQDDWWCSPKYCGYYQTCPYAHGRTLLAMGA